MVADEKDLDPSRIDCTRCPDEYPKYYVNAQGVCYECYLNALVPGWYQEAEQYLWDAFWELSRATCTPKTGNTLLDSSMTPIADRAIPRGAKPRYTRLQRKLPTWPAKPLWQLEDEGEGF